MTKKERKIMAAAVLVAARRLGGAPQLAKALGIPKTTVYRWIKAESVITIPYAKKCAEVSELMVSDFRPDVAGF
jgi:predicted DNA-binding transcriptional regulator YafY